MEIGLFMNTAVTDFFSGSCTLGALGAFLSCWRLLVGLA